MVRAFCALLIDEFAALRQCKFNQGRFGNRNRFSGTRACTALILANDEGKGTRSEKGLMRFQVRTILADVSSTDIEVLAFTTKNE